MPIKSRSRRVTELDSSNVSLHAAASSVRRSGMPGLLPLFAATDTAVCCSQGIIQETALIEWPSLRYVSNHPLPMRCLGVSLTCYSASSCLAFTGLEYIYSHLGGIFAGIPQHRAGAGAGRRDHAVSACGEHSPVGAVDYRLPALGSSWSYDVPFLRGLLAAQMWQVSAAQMEAAERLALRVVDASGQLHILCHVYISALGQHWILVGRNCNSATSRVSDPNRSREHLRSQGSD